jgi:putative membrane protein
MTIYEHPMGPASWLWMALLLIALTALLVAAIVAGVRLLGRAATEPPPVTPADRVLAERFARGEITELEYHHRLAALRAVHR